MSVQGTLILIASLIVAANTASVRLSRAVPTVAAPEATVSNVRPQTNITTQGNITGSADPAESSIPANNNPTEAPDMETEEPPEADEMPENSTLTDQQQQAEAGETEEPPENEDPTPGVAVDAQVTPDYYDPYPAAPVYVLPPWWPRLYSNNAFWYYIWN